MNIIAYGSVFLTLLSSILGQYCNGIVCSNRPLLTATSPPLLSPFVPTVSHVGYIAKTDEEYSNIINSLTDFGIGPWSPVSYLNTTAIYCNSTIPFANKGQATYPPVGTAFFEVVQFLPTGFPSWFDEYYLTNGPGRHYTALQAIPGITVAQMKTYLASKNAKILMTYAYYVTSQLEVNLFTCIFTQYGYGDIYEILVISPV